MRVHTRGVGHTDSESAQRSLLGGHITRHNMDLSRFPVDHGGAEDGKGHLPHQAIIHAMSACVGEGGLRWGVGGGGGKNERQARA